MDGLLYSFRWVQRIYSSPVQLEAIAYRNPSRVISNPDRMDFVTLSPESRQLVQPVQDTDAVRNDL
jgi:hypothetical protein